jgi:hypothetical protein
LPLGAFPGQHFFVKFHLTGFRGGFPLDHHVQRQIAKVFIYDIGNFFPYRVACTGYYAFTIDKTFVTGGKFQFLTRRDKYFLNRKVFRRLGKTKPPAGAPHGIDNTGFPQLEKNLFQKNGRYILNLRKMVNGYRGALFLKPRKSN